jgi:hypothetical protein
MGDAFTLAVAARRSVEKMVKMVILVDRELEGEKVLEQRSSGIKSNRLARGAHEICNCEFV